MIQVEDVTINNQLLQLLGIDQYSASAPSFSLNYLAEGAANIVYAISYDAPPVQHALRNKAWILRLRKETGDSYSAVQIMTDLDQVWKPMFANEEHAILQTHLVRLDEGTIQHLNYDLRDLETSGRRPVKRRGIKLLVDGNGQSGLLMPNLRSTSGLVVEFKPKWLVQSPSAPSDAGRCRTCAINALRRAAGGEKGKGDSGFCPFDLLSTDIEILELALRKIWPEVKSLESFRKAFEEKVCPILQTIQALQRRMPNVGLTQFLDPAITDLPFSMAIRDCSVLLAAETNRIGHVTITSVKILDLDRKDASESKRSKWADMERSLVQGKWYSSTSPSAECGLYREDRVL